MKKLKNCISSLLAAVIMTAAFCTPALAIVSQYDEKYLSESQQRDIQAATNEWWDAYNSGDQAGMDAAHQAAEDARATSNYSGGADGSEYHPWDDNDSGGYSLLHYRHGGNGRQHQSKRFNLRDTGK